MLGTIKAGFPSPAEEELADTISLDNFLIHNRDATFLLKVTVDSMSGAGILEGGMVIVEKAQNPKTGDSTPIKNINTARNFINRPKS